MRSRHPFVVLTCVLTLYACHDSSAPAPVPASVELVTAPPTSGPAGATLATSPTFVVKDQNGNVMSGVSVTVVVSQGGGSLINAPTTSASGPTSVGQWTLGTTTGTNSLTITVANIAPLTVIVTSAAGPIQTLAIASGDAQSALAGTSPSNPIRLSPTDQYGNRLDRQTATFSIGAGGGAIALTTAQSAPDGLITAPTWVFGKSAVPQQLIATVGGKSVTVNAAVQTNYIIDIRFWGPAMTPEQQAAFTSAANRIRGIVVGSLPPDDATGADPANCGVTGVPPLSEIIPGVVIYASIQSIDGKGGTLAQAGPCYVRSSADLRTEIGEVEIDAADIGSLTAGGSLIDVLTHEMLHVVGVGSFWNQKGLLRNFDTPTVEYTGAGGIQGCRETGGVTTCASAVPVENTGGQGTANSHWRESVFGSELMTGYVNTGALPLSVMTVRSIEDLGYTVNPAGADPYNIFNGNLRQGAASSLLSPLGVAWERSLPVGPFVLPRR